MRQPLSPLAVAGAVAAAIVVILLAYTLAFKKPQAARLPSHPPEFRGPPVGGR